MTPVIPVRSDAAVPGPQSASMDGAAAPSGHSTDGSAYLDDASRDGATAPSDASRDGAAALSFDAGEAEAGEVDAGPSYVRIPAWSVRKRIRSEDGKDIILEEVLSSYADPLPGLMRIRMLAPSGATEHSWMAPSGSVVSDFCRHPSGAISTIVIAPDRIVSLEHLSPGLTPLGTLEMHDPLIASDPHVTDSGADLLANGLAPDAARVASVGEGLVAIVETSWNSTVAYRTSFFDGGWAEPQRTLIEPPAALAPFLPISGSFDTFGAIVAWFRALLDIDDSGNAYVAIWANARRIREHADVFGDGLTPLFADPSTGFARDSDVIVTKMDMAGTRVWSRVVGMTFEDEPYAIRARGGNVAVVGRTRRFTGFDNTTWDAFVSVVSPSGELVGSRALPLDASGIFLAVDALSSGGWVLGGSDGWSQNPDGLSVFSTGTKLLAVLPTIDGALARVPLPEGPRHNEIRTVVADPDRLWFGGHEDGPIMHTGDSDRGLVVATGVLGVVDPVPDP